MPDRLYNLALLKVLHGNTTSNFASFIKDFREITWAVERLNYSLFEAKYQQKEWHRYKTDWFVMSAAVTAKM